MAVELSLKSGQLGVKLQVEEPGTVQLLRQDGSLEKLLESAGYAVQSLSIHLSPQPNQPTQGRRRQMGRASPTSSARPEADRSKDIHKATKVNQKIEMQIRSQDMGALKTFAAAVLFTFSTILYAVAEPISANAR